MRARLIRWGSSLAVELPAETVAALGLTEGREVEIDPRPASAGPSPLLAAMLEEARRLGPGAEPESIDWGPDVGAEIVRDDDPY
ncbi:MazF family transcriptional regulator [Methylobacterium variabile]|jgi:antitoxin MazE|uniref:MazF family transcriptional regulator n=1 Tax=Methylobacterium variabile TaxID=298794 RepID=A0A0J6SXA4_9HYPH|nr:AbrB/MazE/SpoVT family DNA-binding domain-containing protein [Methylobacterium variabile]KMO37958.1 MazF family transcriptional regulator [Methylobacterium variabile]